LERNELDTWLGYPVSPADARKLARDCKFDLEKERDAGTQYYWLSFRKLP
jgi:hypothetical protein